MKSLKSCIASKLVVQSLRMMTYRTKNYEAALEKIEEF